MTETTLLEKRQGLPWSLASNAANTAFYELAFNSSAFVLFLSELTFTKTQIGFLLALFPFAGLISLVVSPAVSRFGLKRTFITFWSARKVFAALLLLAPLLFTQYGPTLALTYVTIVIALFSLCRAVGMTAYQPWRQEYIPASTRGKYFATENLYTGIVSFTAVTISGYVIGRSASLNRFTLLIAIGVAFGLLSIWLFSKIPGGKPVEEKRSDRADRSHFKTALRDRDFRSYLVGAGFVMLAIWSVMSFIPLFMRDIVGLSPGFVVWLQVGTLIGGLLSSYFWGWLADRYGGKPVTLTGISLMLVLPVFWFLLPKGSPWSPYLAMGIAAWQGISRTGWHIGSDRYLFVKVIPTEKKMLYTPVYFAWSGIIGGISQLTGGRILDLFEGISAEVLSFSVDPYTPLLAGGLVFFLLGLLLLRRIRSDSAVTMGEFARLFLRGNPFLAAQSILRYQLAKDETALVSTTERLGQTDSPLTVDELLETLNDPRFNVRFEAIVSIARRPPDPRLNQALREVLLGNDPAMAVMAAWALGRQPDAPPTLALREALDSKYRSVRSHSARALATLGDEALAPILLERIRDEEDPGLQVAYAAALGRLGVKEAAPHLLRLLHESDDEQTRRELAVALANILGEEDRFISLLRESQREPDVTLAQTVISVQKMLLLRQAGDPSLAEILENCVQSLAGGDLEEGVSLISQLAHALPREQFDESARLILQSSVEPISKHGIRRMEYVLLALHALRVGFQGD